MWGLILTLQSELRLGSCWDYGHSYGPLEWTWPISLVCSQSGFWLANLSFWLVHPSPIPTLLLASLHSDSCLLLLYPNPISLSLLRYTKIPFWVCIHGCVSCASFPNLVEHRPCNLSAEFAVPLSSTPACGASPWPKQALTSKAVCSKLDKEFQHNFHLFSHCQRGSSGWLIVRGNQLMDIVSEVLWNNACHSHRDMPQIIPLEVL